MLKNKERKDYQLQKKKKHLLENLTVSSVDLCRRGANQEAYICLKKSLEKREGKAIETQVIKEEGAEKIPEPEEMKAAMTKSFESILADEDISQEERKELIQKNVTDFYNDIYKMARLIEREDKKMELEEISPEIRKALEEAEETRLELEAVKKELETTKATKAEVEELRKSLELKELEEIAKAYRILGKDTKELANKLYNVKKLSEDTYGDYVSLLDEQVEIIEQTGLFKEIGSSRSGGSSEEKRLNQRIQEIRKAEPSLSYENAYVKAYEETAKGV